MIKVYYSLIREVRAIDAAPLTRHHRTGYWALLPETDARCFLWHLQVCLLTVIFRYKNKIILVVIFFVRRVM